MTQRRLAVVASARVSGEQREFGSYRLLRRLGVGGMAETFEAVRRESGGFEQRVCLKRVLPAFSSDPSFVKRFQREARLAASLRHSNVVGVTDFGEVDGVSYIALELVDGVDLRSFLRIQPEHRLDASLVACIGLDLAYALEHAHERLVHRDVSPSNVLIGRSGEAKLADFGLAKPVGGAGVTSSGNVPGKVPYMSPEQIRGETVDARSDLFSLGVVLFEALAGRRPFDGPHDVVTMQRIVEGERLDLNDVAPGVPASLTQCIDRLLEVDREMRTPSATALVDSISAVEGSAQGQRRLASMVEAMRGGPSTRMHVRARQEDPDTELSPPGPLPSNEPAPEAVKARALRRWGAAALVAALLLAGALFVFRSTQTNTEGGAGIVEYR
ncbi:MAG: serine/threonine-protein kinase, partial [Myxococcota bacterium]